MDGKTVNTGSENLAAIDTGTSLIGAPTAAVNAIWGAVSGATPLTGNMSGYYSFRKYRFRPAWRRTWQRVKKFHTSELMMTSITSVYQ